MNARTKRRQALWDREVALARAAGRGNLPLCNLCGGQVGTDQAWHESHADEAPKAFGGRKTGIAHVRCNLVHGAAVVRPRVTKSNNVRARHTGAWRAKRPLPGGRQSRTSKTIAGRVVPRLSGAQKHQRAMAKRRIGL